MVNSKECKENALKKQNILPVKVQYSTVHMITLGLLR
jgi:hypothetical protein